MSPSDLLGLLLVTLATILALCALPSNAQTQQYGVILDAGSSGSRMHVYNWTRRSSASSLPRFNRTNYVQPNSALSNYANNMSDIRANVVEPLLAWAKDKIPSSAWGSTSIYVLATAGMRLLTADKAEAVMQHVDELLRDDKLNPFRYTYRNIRILSGEEEGVFAWLTVNYLNGYFDLPHPDQVLSTGIVEMGGASTQIAFLPAGSILSDKFDMRIAARHYSLYVHSYLDYGNTEAQTWVQQQLISEQPNKDPVVHPCFPKDHVFTFTESGTNRKVAFTGGSDLDNCIRVIEELVYKVSHRRCSPKNCAIGSVYQPTVQRDMQFIAMSAFEKVLSSLKVLQGRELRFQPSDVFDYVNGICKKDNATLYRDQGPGPADKFLPSRCFSGVYTGLLLTKGLGFPNCTLQLTAKKQIGGFDLDWSLGAIIYETERENWECMSRGSSSSSSAAAAGRINRTDSILKLTSTLALNLILLVACMLIAHPLC